MKTKVEMMKSRCGEKVGARNREDVTVRGHFPKKNDRPLDQFTDGTGYFVVFKIYKK